MAFLWSKHRFAGYWCRAVSMSLFPSLEEGYLNFISFFSNFGTNYFFRLVSEVVPIKYCPLDRL